jgi:hypothetical protein
VKVSDKAKLSFLAQAAIRVHTLSAPLTVADSPTPHTPQTLSGEHPNQTILRSRPANERPPDRTAKRPIHPPAFRCINEYVEFLSARKKRSKKGPESNHRSRRKRKGKRGVTGADDTRTIYRSSNPQIWPTIPFGTLVPAPTEREADNGMRSTIEGDGMVLMGGEQPRLRPQGRSDPQVRSQRLPSVLP